jgi:hypothetical protein
MGALKNKNKKALFFAKMILETTFRAVFKGFLN